MGEGGKRGLMRRVVGEESLQRGNSVVAFHPSGIRHYFRGELYNLIWHLMKLKNYYWLPSTINILVGCIWWHCIVQSGSQGALKVNQWDGRPQQGWTTNAFALKLKYFWHLRGIFPAVHQSLPSWLAYWRLADGEGIRFQNKYMQRAGSEIRGRE